jgi:hypothetical protein
MSLKAKIRDDDKRVTPVVDLSIAIISHNHREYLNPCLKSLYEVPQGITFEVFLVDNCSNDGSAEFVEINFPKVKLIVNKQPAGFAANSNRALKQSCGRYLMLLNPDTEVKEGTLKALVEFMDEYPQAGACAAKLLYPDGRLQPSVRAFPSLWVLLIRRTPLRFLIKDSRAVRHFLMLDWDHNSPCEIDWAHGSALVVRREAMEEIGWLDENFFLYGEDLDLCYRLKKAGWSIYYVPQAVIIHHLQEFTYKHFFTRLTLTHYRSLLYFAVKHFPHFLKWR